MSSSNQDHLMSMDELFLTVRGADLEWDMFNVSHGVLCLIALNIQGESVDIYFSDVSYVNCPNRMHEVSLGVADADETNQVWRDLPAFGKALHQSSKLFTIACYEGHFMILASDVWAGSDDKANYTNLSRLNSSPLWINGPTLEQL